MEHIAWPAIVLIIALTSIFLFRREVSGLIGRIRSISKEGITTSAAEQIHKAAIEKPSSSDELMRAFDRISLRQQEDLIKRDLTDKGLENNSEAAKVLIRHLAATQLALFFERVNAIIWGSQINILQHLNAKVEGDTRDAVKSYYDIAATIHPDLFQAYSFENYLNFLIGYGLITESTSRLYITQLGQDFLIFIAETRRTGYRAY